MDPIRSVIYGNKPETYIYKTDKLRAKVNHVLLGTKLIVDEERDSTFKVRTLGRGKGGWVKKSDTTQKELPLKIFFVDVGQGDGVIIESPQGILIVDGGPNKNLYKFLTHRYKTILKKEGEIKIKALIMSHPDWDHFNGLTHILKDTRFKIESIHHNGIIRYAEKPTTNSTLIGTVITKTISGIKRKVLTDTYDDISDIRKLIAGGKLMSSFQNFWLAALDKKNNPALETIKRLSSEDNFVPGFDTAGKNSLQIQVLGPVYSSKLRTTPELITFPDPKNFKNRYTSVSLSHTVNGHSIVLKLIYGNHTILLGGDLNIPAEMHLLEHYRSKENIFEVDVAKSCHHGSSDYLVDYLKAVNPHVNVFSSGDNKSFDHPMADSLGSTAKHTKGAHPLLFSTELSRAVQRSGKIHYGLINLRSNGEILVMAQMKEQNKRTDVWDSFTVPWNGKYSKELGIKSKAPD